VGFVFGRTIVSSVSSAIFNVRIAVIKNQTLPQTLPISLFSATTGAGSDGGAEMIRAHGRKIES